MSFFSPGFTKIQDVILFSNVCRAANAPLSERTFQVHEYFEHM